MSRRITGDGRCDGQACARAGQGRARHRVKDALSLAGPQRGDHRQDEWVRILAGERAEVAAEGGPADGFQGQLRHAC